MMEHRQHHQVRGPLKTCAGSESGHVYQSRQCVTGKVFVVLLAGRDEDDRGGEGRWPRRGVDRVVDPRLPLVVDG